MSRAALWRYVDIKSRIPRCCLLVQKRYRYKKKWASNLPSKTNCELALDHFDAFYSLIFGKKWPSIRISLLSLPKYAALVNSVGDDIETCALLRKLGATHIMSGAKTVNQMMKDQSFEQSKSIVNEINQDGSGINYDNSFITDLDGISTRLVENNSEQALEDGGSIVKKKVSSEHITEDIQTQTTANPGNLDSSTNTVLTPDASVHSTDLQYFMPTKQVFSESEELHLSVERANLYQERAISVTVIPSQPFSFPSYLTVMTFPKGNVSDFPAPKCGSTNLLNYYLLDAASILPVLALSLQPEDNVLDLCAAPGGKTLTMLQMILNHGGHITCNDSSAARISRLRKVLRSYISEELQSQFVSITVKNGLQYNTPSFDKVLVDVPCNSDRHVLTEEDNNLFKPGRVKERLQLSTYQKDLLIAGIRSCKPGGSIVYSTCTLAAVQNDGVIQAAVEELWETSDVDVVVEDLKSIADTFASVFSFHSHTKFGQLVLPSLTSNFGPMYFCKLKRLR